MVLFKTILGIFFSDTYSYWKHRSLHTRLLYPFHKQHHTLSNPSSFAAFALHPIDAIFTFAPIWLFSIAELNLWTPVYLGFLICFSFLSLFIHCGQHVPCLDQWISYFCLNTSRWHNVHHELHNKHYGEVSYIWDLICGTGGDARVEGHPVYAGRVKSAMKVLK